MMLVSQEQQQPKPQQPSIRIDINKDHPTPITNNDTEYYAENDEEEESYGERRSSHELAMFGSSDEIDFVSNVE